MSRLNSINAFQLSIYLRYNVLSFCLQQLPHKLNRVGKIMSVVCRFAVFIFQNENGHSNQAVVRPYSWTWKPIKHRSVSLNEDIRVANFHYFGNNARLYCRHNKLHFWKYARRKRKLSEANRNNFISKWVPCFCLELPLPLINTKTAEFCF